jgi:hypothetical protein
VTASELTRSLPSSLPTRLEPKTEHSIAAFRRGGTSAVAANGDSPPVDRVHHVDEEPSLYGASSLAFKRGVRVRC